jgi:hypothetical protein
MRMCIHGVGVPCIWAGSGERLSAANSPQRLPRDDTHVSIFVLGRKGSMLRSACVVQEFKFLERAHFMGGGRCHRYTTECNIPGRLHTVGQLTIMPLKDEGIPGQSIGRQIGRRRRTTVPLPQGSFRATVRPCKMCICLLLPTAAPYYLDKRHLAQLSMQSLQYTPYILSMHSVYCLI